MHPATDPDVDTEISDERIVKAAAALGLLSGGGHAAPRILARLSDPTVAARDIATVIDGDPALAARVLRVANSAYYGASRAVATVERAIVLLGLDAVRGIAAAACLDRSMPRGAEPSPVDFEALLRHSLTTAAAAEDLARRCRPALAGDAFIAGLLHDFGVTVQVRLDRAGVEALCAALAAEPSLDVIVEEHSRVRVTHEQCVATIFEVWRLPAALVSAVRHHHRPADATAEHRDLASLVHLADWLSVSCGVGFGYECGSGGHDALALSSIGLGTDDLAATAATLAARGEALQQALA